MKRILPFLLLAGAAFAVWWFFLRKPGAKSSPLINAERIGPTFVEDNQATQLLAYVNTEFADRDAAAALAEYTLAAKVAAAQPTIYSSGRPVSNAFTSLLAAFQKSGAYLRLTFDEFRNLAKT